MIMQVSLVFVAVAFIAGLLLGLLILYIKLSRVQKQLRSNGGYLESEKLIKETLQKELKTVYQAKGTVEHALKQRLKEAAIINKRMDEDILLLQKSNDETEALLKAGQPEIHSLKLQLIEANNTIARLKGMLAVK
jgi:predicted  nucleic acid-binding Zn-ribbon protein